MDVIRRHLTRRSIGIAAGIALVLTSAATAAPAIAAAQQPTSVTAVAAPAGTGTACTTAVPCALPVAVEKTAVGGDIVLTGGDYGAVVLKTKSPKRSSVTVAPAEGATVNFTRLETHVPNVVWRGVRVTEVLYLHPGSTGSRVDGVHLDGAGMFIRSNDISVVGSTFENGSSIDGIQVKDSRNVFIAGNTIRNYDQLGSSGLHADCIQVFDSASVTIRSNTIYNCHNTGIIVSGGANKGVKDLLIESNFIQGCLAKSAACGGGTIIDSRYAGTSGVVVRNNTLLSGTVRLAQVPGAVYDRNVIDYLSDCNTPITNSVVARWNTGLCAAPAALAGNGNRQGVVEVANAGAGDLHTVWADDVEIQPSGALLPASTDFDGTTMGAATAGATAAAQRRPIVEAPPVAATPGPVVAPVAPVGSKPAQGGSAAPGAARDTTAPVAVVVSPTTGGTVTGTATLVATATDDVKVEAVGFFFKKTLLGQAIRQADGSWALTLPLTGIQPGAYAIHAKAIDSSGNIGASAEISLTAAR